MSKLSKLFTEQKIDVQNRSGFDMSHENFLTMKVGTLTPVLVEEVIPNETYDLGYLSQIQLPPMATDFYGRVDLRLEAFFVPNRIIWGGWQNFMTMPVNNPYSTGVIRPTQVPYLQVTGVTSADITANLGPGTLADYIGIKVDYGTGATATGTTSVCVPNMLPFLAYHKIYDDWYRNSKLQIPVFEKPNLGTGIFTSSWSNAPWASNYLEYAAFDSSSYKLLDGVDVLSLRQRNWAKDYFTTAALYPQASGNLNGATFSINGATASIASVRAANTLQRWLDRNNIAGERYADQIKATFGVYPSDSTTDRAIFLGADSLGIYNKSVFTTSERNSTVSQNQNPFAGNVGSKSANAQAFGDGKLIDSFKTTEHGWIMVLASIVPHATYSTGTRRTFFHSKISDYANPLLQGLGEQVIYGEELQDRLPLLNSSPKTTFGYQQQYSEYKYHADEVHGLLRDGQSLESFALQRSFKDANAPSLGYDFISIPTDFMDQVTATESTLSTYGAWANFYWNFKKVSPLSEYVIPTLGDLKDTHKETIPYRGTML